MGRQKKDPNEVRNRRLWIRINKDEEEHLNRVSEELNLNKSDALRVLILEAENILIQSGRNR